MNNIIKRVWVRNRMVNIDYLGGSAFYAEDGGHTFKISGAESDGSAIALSGTVAGVFLRPDNTDVAITGSCTGGVVSVTLPANCYDVQGRFGLTIFLTSDDQKTAIYAAVGNVARTSSGAVAPQTTADVVDLINRISAAVATIPQSWTGLMADIAPTYSASAVYPAGAYVYYNGDLYRCTTAITTAETWTPAHWTTANLGTDLRDLKAALSDTLTIDATPVSNSNTNINEAGKIITVSNSWKIYYARVEQGRTYNITTHDDYIIAAFYNSDRIPQVDDVSYNSQRIVFAADGINKVVSPINGYLCFRSSTTKTDEKITCLTAVDAENRKTTDGTTETTIIQATAISNNNTNINASGELISTSNAWMMYSAPVKKGVKYSVVLHDNSFVYGFFKTAQAPAVGNVSYNGERVASNSVWNPKFTSPVDGYICFRSVPTKTDEKIVCESAKDYNARYRITNCENEISEINTELSALNSDVSEAQDDLDIISESIDINAYGVSQSNTNIGASGTIITVEQEHEWMVYYARVKKGIRYSAVIHDEAFIYAFYNTIGVPGVNSVSYDGSRVVGTINDTSFVSPVDGYVCFRSALTRTDEKIVCESAIDFDARHNVNTIINPVVSAVTPISNSNTSIDENGELISATQDSGYMMYYAKVQKGVQYTIVAHGEDTVYGFFDSANAPVVGDVSYDEKRMSINTFGAKIITAPISGYVCYRSSDVKTDEKICRNIITPDMFRGTDTQKLQGALDALENIGGTILLNRHYTLNANLETSNDSNKDVLIRFVGVDDATIHFNGYRIKGRNSTHSGAYGGLSFERVTCIEDAGFTGMMIDGNTLLRVFIKNCIISGFDYVVQCRALSTVAEDFLQSIYIESCLLRNIKGAVMINPADTQSFDLRISNCVIEFGGAVIISYNSHGIWIYNNLVENLKGTAISVREVSNKVAIEGNFFEDNGYDMSSRENEASVLSLYYIKTNSAIKGASVSFKNNCLLNPSAPSGTIDKAIVLPNTEIIGVVSIEDNQFDDGYLPIYGAKEGKYSKLLFINNVSHEKDFDQGQYDCENYATVITPDMINNLFA